MKTLYVISTPIGNKEDISLRAIRILSEVDVIACEDTRKTGMLLQHFRQVRPPARSDLRPGQTWMHSPALLSYYEENETKRIPEILKLLKEGKDVALVSNAGTPTISDPGYKLIIECQNLGIKIVPVPGPAALLTALVSSGLPPDKFLFLGYLPLKKGRRQKIWDLITTMHASKVFITIVIYEAPHRLIKTLKDIQENFADIDIVICRELTKIYEEVRHEKVSEAIAYFEKKRPLGEFTLLFNLNGKKR
jgi:16S rRNA (cytidine1402-2'-O)-methyltransferase